MGLMCRLLASALIARSPGASPMPTRVDVLICGGTVFSGSGAESVGDVAITGDQMTGKAAGQALPHRLTPGTCP